MGHGTHTTGTIVALGGIGVAPSARWIACRNLGRNLGNPAVYLDCMQFLFAPFPTDGDPFTDGDITRGADLVNNSWGCPPPEGCDAGTLAVAVEHLYHAGQMYVISAGNDGPNCSTIDSPANAEYGLSVGAIGPDGDLTGFSSRGPITNDGSGRIKPDIAAPGSDILSSVPGGGFDSLQGTSMAGPHVAGVIALMWSANPDLKGDIDRTRQIIEETAKFHTGSDICGPDADGENNLYGFGTIDALAAVEMALEVSDK
jgi:subtilisin family serine protease